VNGHSLKHHFCMFKRSQVKHNSLDCHYFFGIFFINCKVYMLKLDTNQKCFCIFKTLKHWKWIVPVFFKCPFFLPNGHHSFWKLKRILTLMIRMAKWFELMKIVLVTNLSTFGSKVLLTLKNMNFENVFLTKVVHVYVIECMNAYYTWYKINLYSKCIYI